MDNKVDKKRLLLEGVFRLKVSHEEAAGILAGIALDGAKAAKGAGGPSVRKQLRRYRRAVKALKLQCLQVEMVLAEFDEPL